MNKISHPQQALLNEYKGYVFEFLFAKILSQKIPAKYFDGEIEFIASLNNEEIQRLKEYQHYIYSHDLILYRGLNVLAEKAVDFYYQGRNENIIKKIELVSRKKNVSDNADVVIYYLNNNGVNEDHLSLKLCKDNVYVNTKSAGIKSFLTKYFHADMEIQKRLNATTVQSFEKMRFQILDFYGHDLSMTDFQSWLGDGNSSLPGNLPEVVRSHLLNYYHECLQGIYLEVYEITKNNPEFASQAFLHLCGLTHSTTHLFCFHKGTKSYDLSKIIELCAGELIGEVPQIIPPARGSSYFLVDYKKVSLQIRVKPMRDFTAPAMKINCSVKLKT